MPKFEVRWKETRLISCVAEVAAESAADAVKKAQAYEIDEDKEEYIEETECHTEEIHPGRAKELE